MYGRRADVDLQQFVKVFIGVTGIDRVAHYRYYYGAREWGWWFGVFRGSSSFCNLGDGVGNGACQANYDNVAAFGVSRAGFERVRVEAD